MMISKENLCNNGRCVLVRMGNNRHPNHDVVRNDNDYLVDVDKKTKQWKLNAETGIKNIKKITVGFIVIVFLIGLAVQLFLDPHFVQNSENIHPPDLLNTTTLAIEIIFGIFIALVVYIYAKRQHNENTLVVKKIEMLMNEINTNVLHERTIKKEITEDISDHMNSKLDLIIKNITYSLKMYDNFEGDKDGKKEHWLKLMKNAFDRCYVQFDFHLNLLELMRIMGTSPARKYWRLLGDLQFKSDYWNEDESYDVSDFIDHITTCLDEAKTLKDVIKPLLPKDDFKIK